MNMLKCISSWNIYKGYPILHVQTGLYTNGHVILYTYGYDEQYISMKSENRSNQKYHIKIWINTVSYSLKEWSECTHESLGYNTLINNFICKLVIHDQFILTCTLDLGLSIYEIPRNNKDSLTICNKTKGVIKCEPNDQSVPCTALECIPYEVNSDKVGKCGTRIILIFAGYEHGRVEMFAFYPEDKTFALMDKTCQKSLPVLCFSYDIKSISDDIPLLAVGGLSKRVEILAISQSSGHPKFDSHSHIDTQHGGVHSSCWTSYGLFICHWEGTICCYEYSSKAWTMKYNLASSKLMHCPVILCTCHPIKNDSLSPLCFITKMKINPLLVVVGQNGLITLWNP